jgi:hypothetical protein
MRLGRSRPIPALLRRRATLPTPITLPWPEDFSGGDWSRWTSSGYQGNPPGAGLAVSSGAGVMGTNTAGTGGVRGYPTGAPTQTDQGVLITITLGASNTTASLGSRVE